MTLNKEQTATVLAALRFYQENGQGEPHNRSDAIHDIATDTGELTSLDADDIDALCEDINCNDIHYGPVYLLKALRDLLDKMETPRSRKATQAWGYARMAVAKADLT